MSPGLFVFLVFKNGIWYIDTNLKTQKASAAVVKGEGEMAAMCLEHEQMMPGWAGPGNLGLMLEASWFLCDLFQNIAAKQIFKRVQENR